MHCHPLDSLLHRHPPLIEHEEKIQNITIPNTISEVHMSLKVNKTHQEIDWNEVKLTLVFKSSHHSVLRDVLWFDTLLICLFILGCLFFLTASTVIAKYKHFILLYKEPMVHFFALLLSPLPPVTWSRCLKKKSLKFSHYFCLKLHYAYKLVENESLLPPLSVMGTRAEVWSSSPARCCLVLLGGPIIHPRGCFSAWRSYMLLASKIPNMRTIRLAQVLKADNFSDKHI